MRQGGLVSIIINNYNYGRFVSQAIESALAQSYAPVEVIAVDDGSSDDSAAILRGYGDRIQALFKENGGQASALNAGFACSRGEWIFFLDADDFLTPEAAAQVAGAFRRQARAARVHFRMAIADGDGRRTGQTKPPPGSSPPSGNLRRQALAFPFDLAWQPTSGNAFPAWVLEQILPIPEQDFRILADYYLAHLTPLFGPILFLDRVLACYRLHGSNAYERAELSLDFDHIRTTIEYSQRTTNYLRKFAARLGPHGRGGEPGVGRSVALAANRLISLKLDPARHPCRGERLVGLVREGLAASLGRFDVPPWRRMLFCCWFLAFALAPRPAARRLAEVFLFPEKRGRLKRI